MRVGQTLPEQEITTMAEKANSTASKKNGGITKKEAVRRALSKLGKDASRPDIQKFVKDNYGHQMTLDHISTYKGEIRKEKGHTKTAVTKHAAAQKSEPKKPTTRPLAHGISLTDIETVKGLVGRVGANSLKKLIDVMAR
jgi:hypothetical protein